MQMLTCINWSLLLIQAASSKPSCHVYDGRHANRQLAVIICTKTKRAAVYFCSVLFRRLSS